MGDASLAERIGGEGQSGAGEEDRRGGMVDVESVQRRREQGEVGPRGDLELIDGDQQAAAVGVLADLGRQRGEGVSKGSCVQAWCCGVGLASGDPGTDARDAEVDPTDPLEGLAGALPRARLLSHTGASALEQRLYQTSVARDSLEVDHFEALLLGKVRERAHRDGLPHAARAGKDHVLGTDAAASDNVVEHQVPVTEKAVASCQDGRVVASTGRVRALIHQRQLPRNT